MVGWPSGLRRQFKALVFGRGFLLPEDENISPARCVGPVEMGRDDGTDAVGWETYDGRSHSQPSLLELSFTKNILLVRRGK